MDAEESWTAADVNDVMQASKSGGGATVTWTAFDLGNGKVIRRDLKFEVTALTRRLEVRAEYKRADQQQIMLRPLKGDAGRRGRRWKLCRLCLCNAHPGLVHYHFYEDNPCGLDETRENRPELPNDAHAIESLFETFCEEQLIGQFGVQAGIEW